MLQIIGQEKPTFIIHVFKKVFFFKAYKLGFFGPKIVWILPSFFIYGWWESNDTDCTADQILLAVGNYFSVNIFLTSDDTKPDDNGITLRQFRKDYEQLTNSTRHPGYFSAPDGYDALWVIARALNATLADLKNIGTVHLSSSFSIKTSFI